MNGDGDVLIVEAEPVVCDAVAAVLGREGVPAPGAPSVAGKEKES